MSRLTRLAKTIKKIELSGIELEIHPLKFKDTVKLTELEDKGKQEASLEFLIYTTLRRSIPIEEASDEELKKEIEDLSMEFITSLIENINEVNGLSKKKIDIAKNQKN